jgi:hypothetical protein
MLPTICSPYEKDIPLWLQGVLPQDPIQTDDDSDDWDSDDGVHIKVRRLFIDAIRTMVLTKTRKAKEFVKEKARWHPPTEVDKPSQWLRLLPRIPWMVIPDSKNRLETKNIKVKTTDDVKKWLRDAEARMELEMDADDREHLKRQMVELDQWKPLYPVPDEVPQPLPTIRSILFPENPSVYLSAGEQLLRDRMEKNISAVDSITRGGASRSREVSL